MKYKLIGKPGEVRLWQSRGWGRWEAVYGPDKLANCMKELTKLQDRDRQEIVDDWSHTTDFP